MKQRTTTAFVTDLVHRRGVSERRQRDFAAAGVATYTGSKTDIIYTSHQTAYNRPGVRRRQRTRSRQSSLARLLNGRLTIRVTRRAGWKSPGAGGGGRTRFSGYVTITCILRVYCLCACVGMRVECKLPPTT